MSLLRLVSVLFYDLGNSDLFLDFTWIFIEMLIYLIVV